MKEKAWFVFRPRTVAELTMKNPAGKWLEYRIVKTICLNGIDYKNFAADLLADRQFIEDHFTLCTEPGDCLLITGKRREPELLVIPWHKCFVRYAALRPAVRLVEGVRE